MLVLDVGIEDFVPHFIVYRLRFHHFPSEGIFHHFLKSSRSSFAAFHLLLEVSGIEHRSSAFHSDSLFDFLHAHVVMITIVRQISIRFFASHLTYGEVHATHELKHVVKAECAPSVILARLDHYVRACECGFKRFALVVFPLLLVAIECAHVVQISLSYLLAVCPFIRSHRHFLDAGTVVAVHTTEDAAGRPCAGFLGRDTFLYEQAFAFHHSRSYLVLILVVLRISSHFYRLLQKEKARSSQIAELTTGLHDHINARATQFFGRNET